MKTLISVVAILVQPFIAMPPTHQEVGGSIEKSEQVELPSYEPYEQEKLASSISIKSEPRTAPSVATGSEAEAKMFIYMHESGNRPEAVNSTGCRGLGQACPGSKLPCGADYACQDAWFTNYMKSRYGTWVNAKAFWLANNWW